jgi:hypothetical protein
VGPAPAAGPTDHNQESRGAYNAINPAQVLMRPRAGANPEADRTGDEASTLSGTA